MIQLEVIRERDVEYFQDQVNSTLEEFHRLDYEILDIKNKAVADVDYDFYVCFITYKTTQNP